jgi:hypothetical protein
LLSWNSKEITGRTGIGAENFSAMLENEGFLRNDAPVAAADEIFV